MPNRAVLQFVFSVIWRLITLITSSAETLPALVSYTMTEDSSVPLILGDILANLQSRNFFHENVANVLIFPSSQPFSEYFQLVQKRQSNRVLVSSELQLIRPFDLETACKKRLSFQQCTQANHGCCCDSHSLFCSINLQLAATIEGGIFHTATQQTPFKAFLIEVKIFDQNDQAPAFTPNVFTLKISEGAKFKDKYRLPVAKDGDLGRNSEVSYSLAFIHGRAPNSNKWQSLSKENGLFTISPSPHTLSLMVNGQLDREEIEMYKIVIEAKDRAINPLMRKTGTLTLSLIITDVNDVSPSFKSQNLTISIPENSVGGTVICTIMAQDNDSGPNGQINYAISQPQRELPFKIDADSGLLTVAGELDRELAEEFKIIIEAADRGTPARTSTLPVYIRIIDVNDNPPSISINSTLMENANSSLVPVLGISEGLSVGTAIANVSVSDPDTSENKTITCSITDESFELRQTSSFEYSLQIAKELDYETEKRLEIRVFCQDSGQPYSLKSEALIEVAVINENDNPPVFQEPLIIPPAWLVNSTVIAQFSAVLGSKSKISTNGGITESPTVFLPKSFPLGDAFLRFKAKDADYNHDSGELEDDLYFILKIRDEKHFQPEPKPFPISLFSKPILFSFSDRTGEVFLTSTPNFDGIISVFQGDITVYDAATEPHSTTKNFTIIVGESNNNAPIVRIFNFALANSLSPHQIFDQEQNSSVREVPFYIPRQSQSNSVIGQIVGSDSDLGHAGRITYNLTFPQSPCMSLSINNSTGLLTLLEINNDSNDECQNKAALIVADNGFPKRSTHLLIAFRLFDVSKLSPTIRVNQSIIPIKWSENNETEWEFITSVPRTGGPLFHFGVEIISGLIELTFRIKFCASVTGTFDQPQGISINATSGLIYVANSSIAYSNKTFYVTISNHLWPSLPPSIYKTEMKASGNATIAVRITEVKTIDCQVELIFEVESSGFRRNFRAFCISMFSIAALLCLLIITLVIFLKSTRRKIAIPPMERLFKRKQQPNFSEKVCYQSNSVEVNEPVNVDEVYDSCLQTELPTYTIAPQVFSKAPNFPAASSAVRIESGRLSTIAIKQLAPGYPAVSEISDIYYVMENTHQTDLSSRFHSPKGTTPAHSQRSPSSVGSMESEAKPTTGHANVNIIVHNDFEKAVSLQQIGTLNTNYTSAKIFRIDPNLSPIETAGNSARLGFNPPSLCFIQNKSCCE